MAPVSRFVLARKGPRRLLWILDGTLLDAGAWDPRAGNLPRRHAVEPFERLSRVVMAQLGHGTRDLAVLPSPALVCLSWIGAQHESKKLILYVRHGKLPAASDGQEEGQGFFDSLSNPVPTFVAPDIARTGLFEMQFWISAEVKHAFPEYSYDQSSCHG
jgi:hypothetical protein